MKCRVCQSNTNVFFSLGEMPLVNSFLKRQEDFLQEERYDLSVAFCPSCFLVQLQTVVSPQDLFEDYIYFSSTSDSFLEHCKKSVDYFCSRFSLTKENRVIEIGSNDGSFLQFFKTRGMDILGVDPAKNIASVANQKGIPTIAEFFNLALARKLLEDGKKADVLYGANVLAHVPKILDFAHGIKMILAPSGTAIFEFPYIAGLMENKFDTIYHEHVYYYSVIALRNLFSRADLELYDVEMVPVQGGSLRIFLSHPGSYKETSALKTMIENEFKKKFNHIETYNAIGDSIARLKQNLLDLLNRIKKEGKTIAAYSAPAKGNVLLNYFGIGSNYLDFIVDKSPAKHGLYTPGMHLLVEPVEAIYEKRPDYLMILCWNIANEAIEQMNEYHKQGGKFIIPAPEVKVI